MGLFDKFKKSNEIVIAAPVDGQCVPLSEVSDPTFGEGILGKGAAVIPSTGEIYAPADGEISTIFPTGHAVALTTKDGAEVLIHVGLDTVQLEGKHFETKVANGQKVKKGDLLIKADVAAIKEAGYDVITPVIICNTDAYAQVNVLAENKAVVHGDDLLEIKK